MQVLRPMGMWARGSMRYKSLGRLAKPTSPHSYETDAPVQLRKRHEGPWVWLADREERRPFSTHRFAPCFLTFVRRVHSHTFERGIGAPGPLTGGWFIGVRVDRVMPARDAGAR